MMTCFFIAIVIVLLGILSYYTSAWFGIKPSNTGKMPPHYENLLRSLQEKKKAPTADVPKQKEAFFKR